MSETERLSLKDAAKRLNLTESGVRARYKRGNVKGERDNTGKIWVHVKPQSKGDEGSIQPEMQPTLNPHDEPASEPLIEHFNSEIARLTGELDRLRNEHADASRLAGQVEGLETLIATLRETNTDLRERLDRAEERAFAALNKPGLFARLRAAFRGS